MLILVVLQLIAINNFFIQCVKNITILKKNIKTDRIASSSGLLYVLYEFFCGFTQDNSKGAGKA